MSRPFISRVVPLKRDLRYDRSTGRAHLPVRVCLRDGTAISTTLDLAPGQVELLYIQLERGIELREDTLRQA
ncbi:hypothetical protein [Streptomyces lichenis]|uniref:Uncharacterized protein n=1 Tax=Streptomyces lichenis TaxID=2306967 RepID=A0ABT0IFQ0_9ACTN|nr:hypothetical protein [Streptomyces lichenis]MCK8680163.1 hypothetical protein [Streptomyces lichenis]